MIHIIAHRGASALERENTLSAFERAIGMDAAMLEMDVHLSRDGQGQISDLTLTQIRHFDAGLGEHVPTPAEAIESARGRVELYVELKGHRTVEPAIRAHWGGALATDDGRLDDRRGGGLRTGTRGAAADVAKWTGDVH
ncbi:MAG: glycerophosphodiester phosphodiesterase family protein [Spirochaetia bacterium]